MYVPVEHEALIPLEYTKEIAFAITTCIALSVVFNLSALWSIYNNRKLRNSSTAIIVANLACVDILVTFKDLPMFYRVGMTGKWYFEENWCPSYGLTNVIFIIVSVSTLVTITTDKFSRLKELATPNQGVNNTSQRPIILGYVIAHTTLSYSLSLLWSKYVFVTRKAFCRVEWPPKSGISITFMSSFIFIIPVSVLIYNLLFKTLAKEDNSEKNIENLNTPNESSQRYCKQAQNQIHYAVAVFLVSWTPYVIESVVSGYTQITPMLGAFTACVPLFMTSLLPFVYTKCVHIEPLTPVKGVETSILIVQ